MDQFEQLLIALLDLSDEIYPVSNDTIEATVADLTLIYAPEDPEITVVKDGIYKNILPSDKGLIVLTGGANPEEADEYIKELFEYIHKFQDHQIERFNYLLDQIDREALSLGLRINQVNRYIIIPGPDPFIQVVLQLNDNGRLVASQGYDSPEEGYKLMKRMRVEDILNVIEDGIFSESD